MGETLKALNIFESSTIDTIQFERNKKKFRISSTDHLVENFMPGIDNLMKYSRSEQKRRYRTIRDLSRPPLRHKIINNLPW